MDPVEVNLLLNYSAIKTQLSALGADFQSALKGLGAGSIDLSKSISTKGVVDNLKDDIEEGAKSSGLTLGSLFKAGGGGSWFSDEFKKEVGKVDIGKLITGQGMESMNWMPIVSKLFAPANLIAFFGAMAAFGVTTAIAQQNASTTAVTSTSTNATPGSIAANTGTTQAVTNVIGGLAGSTEAVSDMVAQLENYGLSATDAASVTTTLGEALKLTGGTMSDTFNAQFVQYLQQVGATTASSINDVITGLTNASQSAGVLGGGITGIMTATSNFGLAAQTAGDSVDTIMSSVVRYGTEASVSLTGAQADIDLLTKGLQGTNPVINALIGSVSDIANGLKNNVNTEWDNMNTKIDTTAQTTSGKLALAQMGVNVQQLEGLLTLVKTQQQIDTNTAALDTFSGGVQTINSEFQNTLSLTDQLNIAWSGLSNFMADITTDVTALGLATTWGGFFGELSSIVADVFGENMDKTTTLQFANPSTSNALLNSLEQIAKNTTPSTSPVKVSVSSIISGGLGGTTNATLQSSLKGSGL